MRSWYVVSPEKPNFPAQSNTSNTRRLMLPSVQSTCPSHDFMPSFNQLAVALSTHETIKEMQGHYCKQSVAD